MLNIEHATKHSQINVLSFFFFFWLFFSLHKIAADFAIEATSIFLNDIRSTVGDDVFAKFLNLKSENSMALVIDVSGSMRGELEMIIPLIILNKS